MYTFSNRLKMASFILMAVGALGIGIGFVSMPGSVEEAKAMVASHDDGHGSSHGEEAASDHREETPKLASSGPEHSESHPGSAWQASQASTSAPMGSPWFQAHCIGVPQSNLACRLQRTVQDTRR